MKLQKKSQTITSFTAISFLHEEFNKSGLLNPVDNYLDIRNTTGYQNVEILELGLMCFFVEERLQKM